MNNPETNSSKILALLEKKGRAGAPELGTSMAVMVEIESTGAIRRDGNIQTGRRGRPPVAWVVQDGKEAPVPEQVEVKVKPKPMNKVSATLSRIIKETLESPAGRACSCGMTEDMTAQDLRNLGCGCTNPNYVCPALASVRLKGMNSSVYHLV